METPPNPPPMPADTFTPEPAPIPAPITEPTKLETEPSKSFFGDKFELVQIGMLSLVAAFFIMGILKYRKDIETSNNYQNLQNQIDQLKLKINNPETPQRRKI